MLRFSLTSISTCITSVIRLYAVTILIKGDNTYDNDPPTMWSSVEVNTAIICACMQSLKPLIQKIRPKWLEQSHSSSSETASSGSMWRLKRSRQTTNASDLPDDVLNLRSIESTTSDRSRQFSELPDYEARSYNLAEWPTSRNLQAAG